MNNYDERAIKESEKRTERWKIEKRNEEIRRILKSRLFKDIDFPEDDEDSNDGIEAF